MPYRTAAEILQEVQARGMRKAFFVTALMLEMEAVRAHLTDMGSVAGRDGTIYECGSISDRGQEWLVVVAESGPGTHPAQNVASQGHFLFGDFEVQILVGIGGSRKKDAPIGSVVASDKVYMPYSGKAGNSGFTFRPVTFPLDLRLVNIAKKIRRDKTWPNRVRPPNGGTLPPLAQYPVAFPPVGHVAPIASIEAVLDDPKSELEALLAQGYSDTCVVEMEGYGAVYAASAERTPSIIVRGVSDMTQDKSADSDAALQPIAACHAAAFAFELLSHWGQLYSRPATPSTPPGPNSSANPDVSETAQRNNVAPSQPTSPKPQVSVVLNLSANAGPEDRERIDRLQASLRAIAADEEIEIVEARAGSLRLFVADPNASLMRVGQDALGKALVEREDVTLLGIASIEAFNDLRTVQATFATASKELLSWPAVLPGGQRLERPELQELCSRIEDSIFSTTAVLGAPGAGKSALLATLGNRYIERGWPVLAIKADLLEAEIDSEAKLRDRLGLHDLPSNLVRRFAELGPVLVIVDQLDALAGYLDLRTARLSILLNLVRKLGGVRNIHIVLSSRLFEFQHDSRLKTVSAESVTLQLPAWSEVMAVLEARGVSPAGWPPDAQEVMRSPQALATYLQLNSHLNSEPFTSYQAMLERLWNERVLTGDNGPNRNQLATDIADSMAAEESLWLASARFVERMTDIVALEGAGVLTTVGSSVGFSHQTLFEFALARSFAREPGRLSKFVLERQSSLFLRPKLWAGLTYLRATDINAYHRELETIWKAVSLRTHLRVLLIDFLGAQPNPTDREALLLEMALTQGAMRFRAFRALSGNEGWFARFSRSFIADAMVASDALANAQVEVLARALPFASVDVTKMLKERWLDDPKNDVRVWSVIQSASKWTADILEIALVIVGRMEIAATIVDHQAASIGVEQPEAALRLARAHLDKSLSVAATEGARRAAKTRPTFNAIEDEMAWRLDNDAKEPIKRVLERGNDWDSLSALAEQSPESFIAVMWPWYLQAFEILCRLSGPQEPYLGYPLQYDADYRFEGEADRELPERALLGALRIAVEQIAEKNPGRFASWTAQNDSIALTPVQRIIAHGFAHNPKAFAELGLEFILNDQRRFHLGSIHDLRGTTKALIAATSPFWSPEQIGRFEKAVRQYYPTPPEEKTDIKERMSWRHSIRRAQLDLLRSLPAHQRSAAVQRQVAEGERRYGRQRAGVVFSGARWIGSPLEADAMAKASDDDIVNAFKELPDATGWDHPRNWMTGGNIQLARSFATFAKAHPNRAIRILGQLTKDTGTRAAAYSLDALSEDADPTTVLGLLRNTTAQGFDGDEFRQSAARALERLSNRNIAISEEFIGILENWLNAPAPSEKQEDGEKENSADDERSLESASSEDAIHRSLLWGQGGLEFVPDGEYPVVEALVSLRLMRQERDQVIAFLTAYLDREKSPKIWEGLARFLPYLWPSQPDARNALIERLFTEVPGFVGSRTAAQFLASVHYRDPDLINRHLDPWKTASAGIARQAYGEIVGLIALVRPRLEWAQRRLEEILADEAMTDAHTGLALSAAHVFSEGADRLRSARILARLLRLGGQGVWEAAFDVFRMVDELTPDDGTVEFIHTITDCLPQSPQVSSTFVVDRLATLLPHQAPLVGRLALGLTEKWNAELGDLRTATAMAASQLVDLAITLHRLGPETREVGTTLFEQLISIDAREAEQMLDEIDNRFRRNSTALPRRRLPRRSRASRRRKGATSAIS